MWNWIQRFSSPKYFYSMSAVLIPWFAISALLIGLYGLYLGLFVAPTDYQQGESYRIIFIHVPAAWMSLFVYMVMATSAAIGLIWQIRLADMVAAASAPIRGFFCFSGTGNRFALGQADVGRLLGMGCTINLGTDFTVFVLWLHGAAISDRRSA